MTYLHPRINGVWLTDIGAFGDVTASENYHRGCDSASWTMDRGFRHRLLRAGATVVLHDGPMPYWTGRLAQPGSDGSFTAYGLAPLGDGPLAIDGAGAPTSSPSVATEAAITRGAVPWGYPVGISTLAVGDPDATLTLAGLLDRYSQSSGVEWRVDHLGALRTTPLPTTPIWAVQMSGREDLFTMDDANLVTHLNVTYLDSTSHAFATFVATTTDSAAAAGKWGRVEKNLDLSDYGEITAAQASSYAAGLLSRTGPRMQLNGTVQLQPGQLRTLGDTEAGWGRVHAGQMIRLWGVPDRSKPVPTLHTDMPIGRVERTRSTLTLAPVGATSQSYEDMVAEMFAALAA
jgi:hypothetical protein